MRNLADPENELGPFLQTETGRPIMGKWLLAASGFLVVGTVVAIWIGQARESSKAGRMAAALLKSASNTASGTVDFASLSELPPPVVRYLRHVLTDGQKLIRTAKTRQSGMLRTSATTATWSSCTADQLVIPTAPGFVWNASK
jgi:hypothetical protein